jgi:hypothetical protein
MIEILVKVLYTLLLAGIAGVCVLEAWQVWFDNALQYGRFAATRDGVDAAATGDSFRRLIVQQQSVLYGLFRGSGRKPGEFRFLSGQLPIHAAADLGNIPTSLLDQLKIEAAGVNVTSILTTLRRGIKPPNEITGSIDQLQNTFYVTAHWKDAPRPNSVGTEARTFTPPPQSTIDNASFDLACRIFLTRVASGHPVLRSADEDDFCVFARAMSEFRSYAVARDRALNDNDKKAAAEKLASVQMLTDRLIAANTELPYAYKLGAYIDIERLTTPSVSDAAKVKSILDQAEKRFAEYVTRLDKYDPNASDDDVRERIIYLAGRRGQLNNPQQIAEAGNLRAVLQAVSSAPSLTSGPSAPTSTLQPGASVGAAKAARAGTLCCFVKDAAAKSFFIAMGYVVGNVGDQVVSPATIDDSPSQVVGSVARVFDGVALISIKGSS